jgi:sporulation protein YlmC with PRC-barrel domain
MPARLESTKPRVISASTLVAYRVRSSENDDLGTIEEILIDPRTGRLAYAVVSCVGALGFGDKLFTIPWNLIQWTNEGALVLGCDSARLQAAPAFDPDDWPDFGDESWEREINGYYSVSITASPTPAERQ